MVAKDLIFFVGELVSSWFSASPYNFSGACCSTPKMGWGSLVFSIDLHGPTWAERGEVWGSVKNPPPIRLLYLVVWIGGLRICTPSSCGGEKGRPPNQSSKRNQNNTNWRQADHCSWAFGAPFTTPEGPNPPKPKEKAAKWGQPGPNQSKPMKRNLRNGMGSRAEQKPLAQPASTSPRKKHQEEAFAESALLGCAFFTAMGAVRNAALLRAGQSVVVLGAGGVGQARALRSSELPGCRAGCQQWGEAPDGNHPIHLPRAQPCKPWKSVLCLWLVCSVQFSLKPPLPLAKRHCFSSCF